jgi:hypothetical protein
MMMMVNYQNIISIISFRRSFEDKKHEDKDKQAIKDEKHSDE